MKKPSGAKFLRGLLRHVPIALEDVAAAHLDDADLALRDCLAGLGIGDAQLDARQRKTDGAGAALAVIGVRRIHVGLGHAVALEDLLAGAGLEFDMGLGEQRGAARDEQAHMLDERAVEARIGEQPRVEGRHAHHRGRLRHAGDEVVDVERRQEDHRAAGQQHHVGGDEQAVGVEDRQRVQEHVICREAPGLDQRFGVGEQIVVRQHGALRAPGRA